MILKLAPRILSIAQNHSRRFSQVYNYCKDPFVVTVVGAGLPVGRLAALLLKQNVIIKELRLHCLMDSVCGVGVDVSHLDSNAKVKVYVGPELLKDAITGAKVIIVVGHAQREPGETEEEMFAKNAPHVRNIAIYASEFAKDAMFCIGCQPVNALVPMVSEEFKKAQEYDPRRIIGITNLATIRVNSIIACYTRQDACRVTCPVIGGFCPYSSVAVLSQAKPCGDFPPKLAKNIQAKLSRAEDDVLELKSQEQGRRGCFLSQAFAISRFTNHLSQALTGCKQITEYAFVKQEGDIQSFLPYMLSVVKLGVDGVESTHMPKINDEECALLQNAAIAVANSIALGSSYVTGEKARKPKREPKLPSYCQQDSLDTSSHGFDVIDKIPFAGKLCPSDQLKQPS